MDLDLTDPMALRFSGATEEPTDRSWGRGPRELNAPDLSVGAPQLNYSLERLFLVASAVVESLLRIVGYILCKGHRGSGVKLDVNANLT